MNKIDYKKTAIQLIDEEQRRVREVKGYTPEMDKQYKNNELVRASVCYLRTPFYHEHIKNGSVPPSEFPFKQEYWKPSPDERIAELIKAGGLIASEIDKLRSEKTMIL